MIQALALLLTTSLTCVGLLSAWAATSSRHWFLRTGTLVAVLSLLLLIPAYEPLVAFVLQGMVVVAGVQSARWWHRRKGGETHPPRRAQFSLATMLLVTVYIAIATAVAVQLRASELFDWQNVVLIGVVSGLATLLGLWIVHGRLVRWGLRIALGFVLALSLSLPLVWSIWFVPSFVMYFMWPQNDGLATIWVLIIVCITSILCVILWLIAGFAVTGPIAARKSPRFNNRWKRVLAHCVLFLLAIVLLVPPTGVYYQLMTPLPIPKPEMPDPNGWDDFDAAGKMVENSKVLGTINNYDTATQAQLSTAVKAMAPVYERLKVGLERQVRCPVDFDGFGLNFDSIQSMRSLARALAGRGRLATIEGRIGDAADSSLVGIRFGYAIRRGGLMVNALVGVACSGIGRRSLYDVHEELSSSQCSRLISELSQLERQAKPVEDFVHRDRIWSQHAFGWHNHLIQILEDMTEEGSLFGTIEAFCNAFWRERAEMRLLRLELAIQAWRVTHDRLPKSLSEVVPKYMDEIPVDPFDPDGGLLRYRRTDDGYVLYSVGQNCIDDGGVAPDYETGWWDHNTGDLRLDILYAPDPEPAEEDESEDEDWSVEEFGEVESEP